MLVLVIATAAVLGLVVSGGVYTLVPLDTAVRPGAAPPAPSSAVQAGIELLRSAAVAALLAALVTAAGWSGAVTGALLGLALWTLPVVLLAGSVVHEGTPLRNAAIHAVDWLLKLVVIGAVVGALA